VAGVHDFSEQVDKVTECLSFSFQEEQRDRDELEAHRELKGLFQIVDND
jgi:hypothetical protein